MTIVTIEIDSDWVNDDIKPSDLQWIIDCVAKRSMLDDGNGSNYSTNTPHNFTYTTKHTNINHKDNI